MARLEFEREPSPLVEKLIERASIGEAIEIPGRKPVYNLYSPEGIEIRDILDPKHAPAITKFTTLIVSQSFAKLRGVSPLDIPPGTEVHWGGKGELLRTISLVAADEESYKPTPKGKLNRQVYLNAISEAAKELLAGFPDGDAIFAPIERCGGNIARKLGISGISVEAKRLRFKGYPNLLAAGVNLERNTAEKFAGRRVRILEGVIASGSTECALMAALRNLKIKVGMVDCDAVVICPAGSEFTEDFRQAFGIIGENRAVFAGGVLDEDWYVRYHPQDPLLDELGPEAESFIGCQVLGDGGDLTSI